jgi:hypothetical protein
MFVNDWGALCLDGLDAQVKTTPKGSRWRRVPEAAIRLIKPAR